MRTLRRRAEVVQRLLAANRLGTRKVAIYGRFDEDGVLAIGRLRGLGRRIVHRGSVRVKAAAVGRIHAIPLSECQNCGREHGPIDACLAGVLAQVLIDRDTRFYVTPELLARVDVDEMWERFGGPAVDWLEEELSTLESSAVGTGKSAP